VKYHIPPRSVLWVVVIASVSVFGIWLLVEAVKVEAWDGSTHLDVVFLVKDVDTGQSVPDALVHIEVEMRPDDKITLQGNTAGIAQHPRIEGWPISGHKRMWSETKHVNPPPWHVWVAAPKYQRSAIIHVAALDHTTLTIGPEAARVEVNIMLKKQSR
jgi:hypothetical protein